MSCDAGLSFRRATDPADDPGMAKRLWFLGAVPLATVAVASMGWVAAVNVW